MRFDPQLIEEFDEIGVVLFVEYDKASIDLEGSGVSRYFDCVNVATGFGIGFEEGYLVVFFKKIGAGKSGNAGPDYGDLHGKSS